MSKFLTRTLLSRTSSLMEKGASSRVQPYSMPNLVYELMPLISTLRMVLLLPVSMSPSGHSEFFKYQRKSTTMALTFTGWLAIAWIAALSIQAHVDALATQQALHLWDIAPRCAAVFISSYIGFIPIICWSTAQHFVDLIETWTRLEGLFAHFGCPLRTGLRHQAWTLSISSIVVAVAVSLIFHANPEEKWWFLFKSIHGITFTCLGVNTWKIVCSTMAKVALLQAARLLGDYKEAGVASLRVHRQIWHGISHSVVLASRWWGNVLSLMLFFMFLCVVNISFLLLSVLSSGHPLTMDATFVLIIYWLSLLGVLTICSSAQHLTDAVVEPIKKALLGLSVSARDEAAFIEISQFLRDISLNAPLVSIGGLFTLGRFSILSIFSLATTYIAILSQFAISLENDLDHFNVTEQPQLAVH